MKRIFAYLVLGVALAAPVAAQGLSAETQANIDLSVRIGKELYAHDQSAWHVSDALIEQLRDDEKSLDITYVTERIDADHVRTTFLLLEGAAPTVFFSGVTEGSDVISTEDHRSDSTRPPAAREQISRLTAVNTAREIFKDGLCGQRPNIIVLPSDSGSLLDVYALVPESRPDTIQFGGHERITVDADGGVILNSETKYSNSCLASKIGRDSVAAMVTLPPNVSNVPTPIHVFASLTHELPIYVGAGAHTWEVAGGKISLVDSEAKPN